MKYTTTNNCSWRVGIGNVPKPWIESHLSDHKEAVELYFYRNIKLWDFDVCGDETHDFLFDDGRAFRLEYSWWAEWYHEDDNENGLNYEITISEITAEEAKVTEKNQERDWL